MWEYVKTWEYLNQWAYIRIVVKVMVETTVKLDEKGALGSQENSGKPLSLKKEAALTLKRREDHNY